MPPLNNRPHPKSEWGGLGQRARDDENVMLPLLLLVLRCWAQDNNNQGTGLVQIITMVWGTCPRSPPTGRWKEPAIRDKKEATGKSSRGFR